MTWEATRDFIEGKEVAVTRGNEKYAGRWVRNRYLSPDKSETPLLVGLPKPGPPVLDPIMLSPWRLRDHVALIGSAYQGKTCLAQDLAVQWAARGGGLCYIAADREETLSFLAKLPADRLDDIVWIDTAPEQPPDAIPDDIGVQLDPLCPMRAAPGDKTLRQTIAMDLTDCINENDPGPSDIVCDIAPSIFAAALAMPEVQTLTDVKTLLFDVRAPDRLRDLVETAGLSEAIFKRATEEETPEGIPPITELPFVFSNVLNQRTDPPYLADSGLDLGAAIDAGQIIVLAGYLGAASRGRYRTQIMGIAATTLLRRLQQAVPATEYDGPPFPVVVDDVRSVLPAGSMNVLIDLLTAESRLGGLLTMQSLDLLPDRVVATMQREVDTVCVFQQGTSTASEVLSAWDVDKRAIKRQVARIPEGIVATSCGSFWVARRDIPSDPVLTRACAHLPPERAHETITEAITASVQRHGSPYGKSKG